MLLESQARWAWQTPHLRWRAGILPDSLSPGSSSVPLSRQVSQRPRPTPRSQCPGLPPSSDGSVPEDGVLPAAGRSAGLAGLRPPPPAGEDRHALLLAEAPVRAVSRLDLLAHAALALDHFQQLAVALSLSGRLGLQGQRQRQCRVGLCPFLPRRPDGGERKKEGQGPRSDWAPSPLQRPVTSPGNKSSLDPFLSPVRRWEQKSSPCTLCPAVHPGARLGLSHPEEGAPFTNCLPSRMHFFLAVPQRGCLFLNAQGALSTSGGPAWLVHHK